MVRTLVVTLAAALLATGCSLVIDPEQYAPAECPAGQKACGYKCVSVDDPATGCGGANCVACPAVGANASQACGGDGQCSFACNPGFGDCDQQPATGCEARVDTMTDCGSCGRYCATGCNPEGFVCYTAGSSAAAGAVKGIEEDSATGWTFVLVQGAGGGQLAYLPDVSAPSVQVLASGLGNVSGFSLFGGQGWFGRQNGSGVAEVGHYADLSPLAGLQTLDGIYAPGLTVDLASCSNGTLWIPDVGAPLRFIPPTAATGSEFLSVGNFTALACEPIMNRYFWAESENWGGAIWMTPSLGAGGVTQVADGAGRVGAMAAAQVGGNYVLYWVDVDRGDVWRYEAISVKKDRIFAGSGPTSMDIDVDAAGDAYWTDRVAGTVMAWKSYGSFPRAAHVIGRSPAPGRIMVNAAYVFWADDQDLFIRAVAK